MFQVFSGYSTYLGSPPPFFNFKTMAMEAVDKQGDVLVSKISQSKSNFFFSIPLLSTISTTFHHF